MDATAVVAVTGAIATPLVAIAGYRFNARRAEQDRVSTRELAKEAHAHERELAEGQRTHEAQMRRSERYYEDRRETYLDLLRYCSVVEERIALTEPLMTYEGMPELPEPPSDEERRDLRARVTALGSDLVNELLEDLWGKVHRFNSAVTAYRLARDQEGLELEKATNRMLKRREEVTKALADLGKYVREELRNVLKLA
jgi:hypothetical protein